MLLWSLVVLLLIDCLYFSVVRMCDHIGIGTLLRVWSRRNPDLGSRVITSEPKFWLLCDYAQTRTLALMESN